LNDTFSNFHFSIAMGGRFFSLSLWERVGERAYGFLLSSATPLFPSPSPKGRRERRPMSNDKWKMFMTATVTHFQTEYLFEHGER
jgi:hypothetical protein